MVTNKPFALLSWIGLAAVLPLAARAQGTTPYPVRAPMEQYRMTPDAEIALARSAAPAAISGEADVLVLGASGYETAVKGKNGFVCLVERSWANDFGKPEFWNARVRSPFCYNPAAARSVLPAYLTRTTWALTGVSEAQMEERSNADPATSGIRTPEIGSMCYMLSKEGYLGDDVKGPWHPHLMFFMPHMPDAAWGANLPHSPVFENDAPTSPRTVFVVPVAKWSDGSRDSTSLN